MDRRSAMRVLAAGAPAGIAWLGSQPLAWPAQNEETTGSTHLRMIGMLTTAAVQNVYLLLDLSSASLARGGLPVERVRSLCRAMVRQLDGVIGQLRRLEDEDLTAEDAAFVDGAMQACRALQDDARSLGKYAHRQAPADLRTFEKAHVASDQAIREMLNEKAPASPGAGERGE